MITNESYFLLITPLILELNPISLIGGFMTTNGIRYK
jgi:hypothetical protein